MRTTVLAFALALLAACEADDAAPVQAPLTIPTAAPDEVILDVRADGAALFGRVVPPPPNADPDRVLVLRGERDGRPFLGSLEGARVLDARFAGSALVVLGTDHVLRVHENDQVAELDAQVHGPLSVAADRVAYVRGEPPDLEVARADLRTGAVEAITQGMAPAWSPALSPDGTEVIFVSGASGSPRLYRSHGGPARALPASPRFPTGPSAPRWIGDRLVFEDEQGVASIDLRAGTIAAALPGARDLFALPGGRAVARTEQGPALVEGGSR